MIFDNLLHSRFLIIASLLLLFSWHIVSCAQLVYLVFQWSERLTKIVRCKIKPNTRNFIFSRHKIEENKNFSNIQSVECESDKRARCAVGYWLDGRRESSINRRLSNAF